MATTVTGHTAARTTNSSTQPAPLTAMRSSHKEMVSRSQDVTVIRAPLRG